MVKALRPENRHPDHGLALVAGGRSGRRVQALEPMVAERPSAALDRQLERLRAQNEVLELIASGASLNQVLQQLVRIAERSVRSGRCTIELSDPEVLGSWTEPRRGSAPRAPMMAESPAGPGTGLLRPEPATHRVAGTEARRERHPSGAALRCWSEPIRGPQNENHGILSVQYRDDRELAGEDLEAITELARIAGIAVEQQRREQVRRQASERFTTLSRSLPGVVYQLQVTAEGRLRYTFLSEGLRDVFGIAPEAALADAETLHDCYEMEAGAPLRQRFIDASKSLALWEHESWITTLDGRRRYIHDSARPHRRGDGSVIWEGIILDATRTKEAEVELRRAKEEAEQASHAKTRLLAQLRSANQRFESLVANVPGVVYQRKVTPEGEIFYTYISDGAKDLFGLTPEEVLADSQALFNCHGPDYRKGFRDRLLAASKTLSLWDVEAQIITASGETKYTHAIARPHKEADGSVLWDGLILDSTRIKKAEMALREAKDQAECSNRAKTQFLATMGHELRTPLNAIIGFSEIIADQRLGPVANPNYLDYAKDILASGQELLRHINDILEFTRLESGELQLSEGDVDLARLLEDVAEDARALAVPGGAELVLAPLKDRILLLGDEERLRRLLWHLTSNAIKFTTAGDRIHIAAEVDPDGHAVLSIADTGIGMAPADISKAKEVFAQLDGRLSRRFAGLGLGIPLAMAIAKMHGATLSFTSEVAVGTRATLVLPKTRVITGSGETRGTQAAVGQGRRQPRTGNPSRAPQAPFKGPGIQI
ncbi:MAG: ATP-binding protein [Kiloniellales bacterium]|nr:ATP-binding protein [Kiloniellales bacterium]